MAGLSLSLGLGLGPSVGGGGFSPASLFAASEPGAWYDPSDITTLFQDTAGTVPVTAAGQTVARINDKSGRGNHATQATAASRPQYQLDGARGFLLFDGTDDGMVTNTITPGVDKAQVFAGVRKLSDVGQGLLLENSTSSGTNAGTFVMWAPLTPGAADYGFRSRGSNISASIPQALTYVAPITNVLTGIGDIAGDVSALRVNGTQRTNDTYDQGTGNFLAYPLYIGRRAGTSLPYNGRMYGMIVRFGANLTDDQITQTETWLNAKTGAY